MQHLYKTRQLYGGVFATVIDGLTIPWKPLSIGEYIRYHHDNSRGFIPSACLEDEIFKKCVIDETVLRQIPFLKAGIITTVVQNIWKYSGPTGIDAFNNDLETARQLIEAEGVKALHDIVQVIAMAFPYKPEEIYKMDYETFLLRSVQAEKKLLQLGMISEPISLINSQEKTQLKQKQNKPKIDAKKLWEQQKKNKVPLNQKNSSVSRERWWEKSPILETKEKNKIDFETEKAQIDFSGMTGHEKRDAHLIRAKMIEDAKLIYKDVLEELKKKKK